MPTEMVSLGQYLHCYEYEPKDLSCDQRIKLRSSKNGYLTFISFNPTWNGSICDLRKPILRAIIEMHLGKSTMLLCEMSTPTHLGIQFW